MCIDELMLCKHIRVKVPCFHARLPTRALMQMVTGGRSRVLALARLNYGASSQQYVRAALELANSYALQGLWAQVAEYTQLARNAFVLARREQSSRLTRQLLHARLVLMVFGLVRDACTVNNGQVPEGVAADLAGLLGAEARRLSAQEGAEAEAEEANAGARQLASEVRSFQLRHKYGSWSGQPLEDEARLEERASTPVYGELVSFLRLESPSLRCWLESVHLLLAPQSLAALELVLAHADGGGATLSPARLVLALSEVSAAARVVAGTGLLAWLGKLNTEARVLVDVAQGRLSDVAQGRSEYEEGYVRVVVQIPLAFEELLAKYACDNLDDSAELLEARLQTTQGMAHVFGKETALAEEAFVRALRMLEAAGVEMEICACELYNSVAQLMISRHRQWQEGRKNKSRQEALSWLSTLAGQAAVQQEAARAARSSLRSQRRVSREEEDLRVYKKVFADRWRALRSSTADPTASSVEAASRYLLRSFEIIERCHGQGHPAFGASCIAVASVKNILGDLEASREWLARALRSMETLVPAPERAIAFVQTQVRMLPHRLLHA